MSLRLASTTSRKPDSMALAVPSHLRRQPSSNQTWANASSHFNQTTSIESVMNKSHVLVRSSQACNKIRLLSSTKNGSIDVSHSSNGLESHFEIGGRVQPLSLRASAARADAVTASSMTVRETFPLGNWFKG